MNQTEQRQVEWALPRRISWGPLGVVTPVGCLLVLIAFVIAREGWWAELTWLTTTLVLGLVGLYYLFPLCWELWARESIVLTDNHLLLYRRVGVLRWGQEIRRDEITSVQAARGKQSSYATHYLKNWFSPNPLLGFHSGALEIVTTKSLYAIGVALKESEASLLLRELQGALSQLPESP